MPELIQAQMSCIMKLGCASFAAPSSPTRKASTQESDDRALITVIVVGLTMKFQILCFKIFHGRLKRTMWPRMRKALFENWGG